MVYIAPLWQQIHKTNSIWSEQIDLYFLLTFDRLENPRRTLLKIWKIDTVVLPNVVANHTYKRQSALTHLFPMHSFSTP